MEYKLLRALSIILQTGLVILLLMLLGLLFLACKPVEKPDRAKSSIRTEAQKDLIQQRLLKDIQQQLNLNTLCFERQAKQKSSFF